MREAREHANDLADFKDNAIAPVYVEHFYGRAAAEAYEKASKEDPADEDRAVREALEHAIDLADFEDDAEYGYVGHFYGHTADDSIRVATRERLDADDPMYGEYAHENGGEPGYYDDPSEPFSTILEARPTRVTVLDLGLKCESHEIHGTVKRFSLTNGSVYVLLDNGKGIIFASGELLFPADGQYHNNLIPTNNQRFAKGYLIPTNNQRFAKG